MFKSISKTGIMMGITFLLSLLATLVLGNNMSPEEFGKLALLKSFIIIGGTFSLFGIDQVIIRMGANSKLSQKLIVNIWFILIFSSLFFSLIFKIIFLLKQKEFLFLWIIIFCNSNLIYFAAFFRVRHKFVISQLAYNLWKVLLFTASILLIFLYSSPILTKDLYFILSLFCFLSFILSLIYSYFYFGDLIDFKFDRNIMSLLKNGFAFWAINVLSLLFAGLDRFLISKLSNEIILGEYYAITFIFTTSFSMLGSAIGYVIYPFLVNKQKVSLNYMLLFYMIFSMILYVVFICVGDKIFSIAYNDRYDYVISNNLISIVLTIGLIQGMHTIVHFMVYAYANSHQLSIYFKVTAVICFIYTIFFYFFSYHTLLDLFNITIVVLFFWFIKLLSLIVLFYYVLNNKK